jgi:hypothetical protein
MIRRSDQEKNRDMTLGKGLLAMLAVWSAGLVIPHSACADEWDKRTMLTFSQSVALPGRVLPAGTYVFQLADAPSNRHIVQVFDRDGKVLATLLTIPTVRIAAADDTRIAFAEQAAAVPSPIKKWFYPGELDGEEFIYPTHTR